MVQYERQRFAGVGRTRWTQVGAISGLVGGVSLALLTAAIHTGLSDEQFVIVNPLGAIATILLALALPAFYLSERRWFGTLATAGYWLMAVGWVVTAATLALFALGSETAGLAFPLGWLVTMVGAFVLGVSMLRTDAEVLSRLGAWLLVAALPVGLPLSVAFTWYVLGQVDTPWNGPLLLYSVAWTVFSYRLWTRRPAPSVVGPTPR